MVLNFGHSNLFRVSNLVLRISIRYEKAYKQPFIIGWTCCFDAKFGVILTGLTGLTCYYQRNKKFFKKYSFPAWVSADLIEKILDAGCSILDFIANDVKLFSRRRNDDGQYRRCGWQSQFQ